MFKMDSNLYLELFPIQGFIALPTQSMQEVVTSVATKLTQFIIKSSKKLKNAAILSQNFSDNNATYNDMVQSSETIVKSLKQLIKVVNETVAVNYSNDEIVSEETDMAAQNLMVAGENLHMCCQVLVSTNGEIVDSSYNLDLVSNISKLFQCLVVLLLCVDNAEVRLVIELSRSVMDHLTQLCSSQDTEDLFENFSSFGNAVYQFHSRVSQRRDDILSAANQAKLTKALTALQRSMPVLATAFTFFMKYPHNNEAVSAKSFAVKQVEETVNKIVSLVKIKSSERDLVVDTNIGIFVSHIQSIDQIIDPENRHNSINFKLETLVQSMIQQLMFITSYITYHAPENSRKADHLVKESQKLLELVSTVVKMSPTAAGFPSHNGDASPMNVETSSEYDSVCRAVRGKLKNIANCVDSLVSALFSYTFTITDQPLKSLLSAFEPSVRNPTPSTLTRRDSAVATFHSHANDVVQIGRFIEILCSDPDLYSGFDPCLSHLASVSSQIAQVCSKGNESGFETAEEKLEHLQKLAGEWFETFHDLLRSCVLSLDLAVLTDTVEKSIISDFEKCHEDIVNFDDSALSTHMISATEKVKLLAAIANHVIGVNPDLLFRNGVRAHVKLLNEAITCAVASGNLLIEDTARLPSQEAFLASASHLKTKVRDVCSALFSSDNHPPITSDDRKGVRNVTDPDKVNGMIFEMRKLSNKLACLGFEPKVPLSKPVFNSASDKPDLKSVPEVVDQMPEASGSAIVVEKTEEKLKEENPSTHDPSTSLLTTEFVNACFHVDKTAKAEIYLNKMREITRFLTEACYDAEPCLRTWKESIPDTPDCRTSEINQAQSASEKVSEMKNNLRESFNLIEGYVTTEDDLDRNLLTSLSQSWSDSCRNLLSSLDAVLKVYLVSLRRFVLIRKKTGVDQNLTPSVGHSFDLNPSHEGVAIMKRTNETLSILLSDVITLFKRELKNNSEKANQPLVTRLDILQSRSKKVAFDLSSELKEMSNNSPKLSETPCDYSHARVIYCAAKHFTSRDLDQTRMIEYKDYIQSLCQSALDRINSSLESGSLQLKMTLKLKKMKNRVDLTRESIQDVIGFILKKESTTPLLTQHGHLVFHLLFLHRRFLLDVSRTFLVSKALILLRRSEATEKKSEGEVQLETLCSVPLKKSENVMANTAEKQLSSSYSERLAALTKQRKEREKELLHLLSDIDADARVAEPQDSSKAVKVEE